MKVDPEKFGWWIERKGQALLVWDERRTTARQEKTLRDHHTLEICIALCAVSLILGLMGRESAACLRSICVLAAFIVFLKFLQFTVIVLNGKEGADE
jgi:hypothetical protein